jgi:serine/threonine-protein kinase HipA
MTTLTLDVRLDGFQHPVGTLTRRDDGAVTFAYTPEHLNGPEALPISFSLPLQDEAFDDPASRSYFENLLQERDGHMRQTMDRERIATGDIVEILRYLGKDCSGALSILPQGAPPVKIPGDFGKE